MKSTVNVCCIGSGVMGGALMKAVVKVTGGDKLIIADANPEKAKAFAAEAGCAAAASNKDAVKGADVVFIAVKPSFIGAVMEDVAPYLAGKTVVSVAAGVPLASVRESYAFNAMMSGRDGSETVTFIRLMPNIPATVGEAMIALCTESGVPAAAENSAVQTVMTLLSQAGRVEQVPEKLMDAVTAVSGSGPAYAFMFIEALADAAVKFGMPRAQAYVYAAQTLKGAAAMQLATGTHPGALKDAVCSPAGTTIEAVKVLEDRGFRSAVIGAAEAAFEKSIELGKK